MKEGGMLLYDVEARNMIAQEHAELLRAQAAGRSGERRARRWLTAGNDLRGYPAVAAEDETEATLAAEPPKQAERKPRPQLGEQVSG